MAASMWRMNGLCRSMTGVLLLCALLFSSEVMCQDDSTPNIEASNAGTDAPAAVSTLNPGPTVVPSDGPSGDSAGFTVAPENVPTSRHNDQDGGTLGNPKDLNISRVITDTHVPKISPEIECVGEGEIHEQSAVKAEVTTKDCEATKRIFEDNLAHWCSSEKCDLKIFQENSNVLMTSSDAKLSSLAGSLKSEALKGELGLKNVNVPPSSNSSVFVGVLVTGLLAALGMIVGYFKCQRKPETKGEKLAEEAFPVDQENQGNTLASEAPLNPPPETQEKPSVNGESLEAVKTETSPPTNGHSTAKTADTEL
ncbi:hematopoietic progenitor cell antigen CD34 [Xiphophorus couchianus]|uniref:hematopoietic progenitor cell antigen CD34 n=1 Tax=Xiphophorus couchianus TaxID=32473 RepID=UPI00101709EF|nr:hematopoietic progenitor cell antigen CD34-like [Xiphophorus couchianus]XP_027866835.1 hematopoietic progenitor cell antigen CD34-like [Xiphophorus couchianus]